MEPRSCKCDKETFSSIKGWKYLIRWATIGFSSRTLWSWFGRLVDQSVYCLPTYLAITILALSLFYKKMPFRVTYFPKLLYYTSLQNPTVESRVAPTSQVSMSAMLFKNVELASNRIAIVPSFVKIVQLVLLLKRGGGTHRQCNDLIQLSFFTRTS
jgi:hypothetical protein